MLRYRRAGSAAHDWGLSPIQDLSPTGVRFIAEKPFALGSQLELSLQLPMSEEPIHLMGVVVWQRLSEHQSMAEHGVNFLKIQADVSQALNEAVKVFAQRRDTGGSHEAT